MTIDGLTDCSNDELLIEADRLAAQSRATTAALIRVLIEVERRRLHLSLGYSSLFVYCTTRLRLSEAAAYSRITAARWARHFPTVLDYLNDGSLTLSGFTRLAPNLTPEGGQRLLEAARFKSTRETERLVAALRPASNVPTTIRALPVRMRTTPGRTADDSRAHGSLLDSAVVGNSVAREGETAGERSMTVMAGATSPARRIPQSAVDSTTTSRSLLRVAISQDTHDKLERLRALMRHRNPTGDVAAILDEALTLLLARVERERCGKTTRRSRAVPASPAVPAAAPIAPRAGTSGQAPGQRSPTRYIPSSIRRAIWVRDGSRCAFVGPDGRCRETAFLEIHHLHPFAAGGATTADNLALRCRAHNNFEALVFFGERSGNKNPGARGDPK